MGHALGAVRYAAAVLGWSARLLDAPADGDVSALLGLDRDADFAGLSSEDREHPDGLVVVAPGREIDAAVEWIESGLGEWREALREGDWTGAANPLSPEHVAWPAIEDVATAAAKPRTVRVIPSGRRRDGSRGIRRHAGGRSSRGPPHPSTAQRGGHGRSHVSPSAAFFALVDRLVPRPGLPPWDVLPWAPRVHPVLFVHRVEGLAPGLYLLERSVGAHASLREALRPSFAWERAEGGPEGLRLFRLEEGDARSFARFASCQQEIAGDSAFAVAMLADLEPVQEDGPWWYRRLHWEAGLLGQVLYLEAEALGVRATGIGCFFDDVVHDALGLVGARFRDFYHFTVGGAVEDRRLTTRPGYDDVVTRRA